MVKCDVFGLKYSAGLTSLINTLCYLHKYLVHVKGVDAHLSGSIL